MKRGQDEGFLEAELVAFVGVDVQGQELVGLNEGVQWRFRLASLRQFCREGVRLVMLDPSIVCRCVRVDKIYFGSAPYPGACYGGCYNIRSRNWRPRWPISRSMSNAPFALYHLLAQFWTTRHPPPLTISMDKFVLYVLCVYSCFLNCGLSLSLLFFVSLPYSFDRNQQTWSSLDYMHFSGNVFPFETINRNLTLKKNKI